MVGIISLLFGICQLNHCYTYKDDKSKPLVCFYLLEEELYKLLKLHIKEDKKNHYSPH